MLDFKAVLKKIYDSAEFKVYFKENSNSYLINAIYLQDWQLNFFNPQTQIITVFKFNKKISSSQLEKEERTFSKLNTEISFDLKDIKDVLKTQIKTSYSNETFTKTIIILQQDSEPIWNITLLASSFKILNLKISALTGKILYESYDKLIDLR